MLTHYMIPVKKRLLLWKSEKKNMNKRLEEVLQKRKKKELSVAGATVVLLVIMVTIIAGIRLGFGTEMSLFFGAVLAILISLFLGETWKNIEKNVVQFLSGTLVVMLILISVGIMVGAWIIGGTVPALMYYGLKIVSPSLVLPTAFVLCAVMSIFTGTSFGSIATMGLALTGVAVGVGVPVPMVAGAVVAGAFVGDKMSPMSDSTNLCSALTGVGLYDHIGSMMYTSIPAAIISLIIYFVLGLQYAPSGSVGVSQDVQLMLTTIGDNFHITPVLLIPAILMLVVSALKIPAVLGLSGCAVFSIIFASVSQGVPFQTVVKVAYSGYVSETGVSLVDTILTRGGLKSMMGTVALIILACLMGGALHSTGALSVIMEKGLMKKIHSPKQLVLATMLYSYLILFMSGNQMLGAVMTAPAFKESYDKMGLHRKVLSRTLGDTSIVAAGLIPWGVSVAYTTGVLGCDASYIPYEVFCYIVPLFTILAAVTGWATWKADGTPVRSKNK